MTGEQAEPAKRRSKRTWVVGLVVALVVALTAFGWSAWITHSYQRDFQQWVKHEKPQLMSTTPLSPMTAMDYPGEVHTDGRQAQEEGCAKVGPTRKKIDKAAAALPEIADWPLLPLLNPAYGHAQDRAERRHHLVGSYRAEADKVLAATQRDCTFDSKYLAAMQRYNALVDDADELLDPKGPHPDGSICDDKDGCIPSDPTKLKSYASRMTKAHRHERSEVMALYEAASCERTSFGSACASIADAYKAYLKVDQAYNRLIIPGTYEQVNVAVERNDRAWKTFEKRSAKILESKHPGLRSVTNFTDEPTDADAFFAGVAQSRLRHLLSSRSTVDRELV